MSKETGGSILYRTDRFAWDFQKGNLLSKKIENRFGEPAHVVEYQYDKNNNPIVERINSGGGWHTFYRTFSDDGFNLKLFETDREGKLTCYTYVPQTNLLASEIVYEGSMIRKRTFHFYDDCAVCIKIIIDDGQTEDPYDLQGVTYRKIIQIAPRQQLPCFGLPEVVEEKTIDSFGNEKLLKKTIYAYHPSGKILEEHHYDANNTYCYSIINRYDERERLVSTKDPCGHTTHFTYDLNNNLTTITGPRPDQHREITYDQANRPIRIAERQTDGSILVIEKRYDKLGRLIEEIDVCNNRTRYEYDTLGRTIAIYHPDGAVERKEYDVVGNIIKEVDPEGYETRKRFYAYGQPLSIHHPDGSEEYFAYNPTETLRTHTDKNGAITVYTYDIFDHLIREETYSQSGTLLKTTSATFSPFHKLTETDPEGITTYYHYNFTGKKIAEQTGNRTLYYAYDLLGRCVRIQDDDVITSKAYDFLDHIIEEIAENDEEIVQQTRYAFDEAGNRTHVINSKGVIETLYNTQGQPIQKKDPLGHITTLNYTYGNGLIKTETNPKRIQKITFYDSRDREIKILKRNALGHLIQQVQRKYDKNSNLIEQTHFIYEGTTLLNTIAHHLDYGPNNRLECCIEANQKQTRFIYDHRGRLQTIIKPNGSQLHHSYDDLGRLTRYFSSDFDYHYTYDHLERPLNIHDTTTNTTTCRAYDILGNITQETLANDLILRNTYDPQGRRLTLTLPDHSHINYTYKATQLFQITRDPFTYTYEKRDLEGNITQISFPEELGKATIERDPLGRWKQFTTPYYTSNFPTDAYDSTGNLLRYHYIDSEGSIDAFYEYDDLDQLISEKEHTYHYDSLNNRRRKDLIKQDINHLCQLTHDGTKNYQYDPNGNLISDGTHFFEYDTQDRLISVQKEDLLINYTYDPFHRRLSKAIYENGKEIKKENYLWDNDNEIGATNCFGNIYELRILGEGLGAEIGAAVLFEIEDSSYLPIHDHRGCLVTVVDIFSQRSLETYRYTAFGEQLTGGELSPWRFASKRIDSETSYIFFGRRYYSPSLGRWITPDPQGFDDGPNLYAYVHNCPLTAIDPYGLWSNPFAGTRNIADFAGRLYRTAFRGIELIGAHLIPLPTIGDAIRAIGRWGRGGELSDFDYLFENYNRIHTVIGRKVEGVSVPYSNGMMTTYKEAVANAEDMSREYGDVEVDLLYKATKGFIRDIIGCAVAKMGIPTSYEQMCAEYFASYLSRDANHEFHYNVHSRGGINAMNTSKLLTADQRSHITLNSFGSATLIPNGTFGSVTNYVSPYDAVSMSSTFNYGMALLNNKDINVVFLTPTSKSPLKEHSIKGDTYWKQIEDLGKKFKREYFHE